MNFVVLVLVLIAQHFAHTGGLPDATPHGYVSLFRRGGAIRKLGADAALLLWLLIPLLLAALAHTYLLGVYGGMILLIAIFFLLVFFALGYADCRQAISQLGKKPVRTGCTSLAPSVSPNAGHAEKHAFAVLTTLRCVMAPLFWTYVLSAYGALIVLLVYAFNRFFPQHSAALKLIRVLEWLPARLLTISYSIDCRFEKSWQACGFFASRATSEELVNGFIVPHILEQTSLKRNNPRVLLARQMVSWLAVMALITLVATFA